MSNKFSKQTWDPAWEELKWKWSSQLWSNFNGSCMESPERILRLRRDFTLLFTDRSHLYDWVAHGTLIMTWRLKKLSNSELFKSLSCNNSKKLLFYAAYKNKRTDMIVYLLRLHTVLVRNYEAASDQFLRFRSVLSTPGRTALCSAPSTYFYVLETVTKYHLSGAMEKPHSIVRGEPQLPTRRQSLPSVGGAVLL